MDKLEALKKHFPDAKNIEQIDSIRFIIDGTEYSLYDDDELEDRARENIEEIFDSSYDDGSITEWVNKNGGIENFYNEEYIGDFRIEDSDTFGDMSDNEIIDVLKNEYCYFEDNIPRSALDMNKMVDYVWDIDGAQGLSLYDGNLTWVDGGYTLIREGA